MFAEMWVVKADARTSRALVHMTAMLGKSAWEVAYLGIHVF